MSVTCGFYNNYNDGRKYNASQMSRLFDGMITDGVFASIGDCLVVNATSGNIVTVGTGKCWFNHTWTENDAPLLVTCPDTHPVLNRIDAVVVEVNSNENIRDNFIKVVSGVESSKPVKPTLANADGVYQHALCYIYRAADTTEITQADITNAVGTDETPFITAMLQTISLDKLLGQWESELDQFVDQEKLDIDEFLTQEETDVNKFMTDKETDFNTWYANMVQLMADVIDETNTWSDNQKTTILEWFEHMKGQLSADAAANLQIQLDKSEVERILMAGFVDGSKTFSDDGRVITSVDSSGRTLVKTFSEDFLECTTVLTDVNTTELGRMTKQFAANGKTLNTEVTII